jgi:hypothetical protein
MNHAIRPDLAAALAAVALALPSRGATAPATAATLPDARHIARGWEIPSRGYADQPYIVRTDDGAWLCVMTTGAGKEGDPGQTVVSMRSTDRGLTWDEPVLLEPIDGPEASYAVMLKVPYGRVYCFYNHNTDRVPEVKREDKGVYKRVDSLGHYVFKYTDDHGKTWSPQRYEVPIREFQCDRDNVYGGKLRFFWNVGRPLILGDEAVMVLHKVGAMGDGFFAQSEGAFFASRSILSERNPEKITFETRPDGDIGLRTPAGGGRVAEEQSISKLSDGSLFCVYRTIDGWPTTGYSRDAGRTWTKPAYMTYAPDGRRVKHPRAANFAWNCSNGMFLYWFHNHGGRFVGELGAAGKDGRSPYDDRNPAWLMAGREVDTPAGKRIEWSQPEILLYDDDPYIRMSYPDLVEDGGKFFITETQKNIGRLHEIPDPIVKGLFNQWTTRAVSTNGLALSLPAGKPMPAAARIPALPRLNNRDAKRPDHGVIDLRAGFSFDLWLAPEAIAKAGALFDSRAETGAGILVESDGAGAIHLSMNDSRQQCAWRSDRGVFGKDGPQHVVITVDGGPKIVTFVVNGVLCDGGDERQFGWGRYSSTLRTPTGAPEARIGAGIRSLRVYTRALRTSEAVGNFRAGCPQQP